jgi:hypothetical protein
LFLQDFILHAFSKIAFTPLTTRQHGLHLFAVISSPSQNAAASRSWRAIQSGHSGRFPDRR